MTSCALKHTMGSAPRYLLYIEYLSVGVFSASCCNPNFPPARDTIQLTTKVVVDHQIRLLLCGRHRRRSLLLFNSLFDDASVASHSEPHHEASHSPLVTLRTQERFVLTSPRELLNGKFRGWDLV